jgi:hypothetical protein
MDLPYFLLIFSLFFPPLPKLQHKEGINMRQGRAWAEGSNGVDSTSPPAASKELPSMPLLGEGTTRGGGAQKKEREQRVGRNLLTIPLIPFIRKHTLSNG